MPLQQETVQPSVENAGQEIDAALRQMPSNAEVVVPGTLSAGATLAVPVSAPQAAKPLVPASVAIGSIVLGVLLMAFTVIQARRRGANRASGGVVTAADERSASRVGVSFATTTTNQALAEIAMQMKKQSQQLRAAHERIEHLEQQAAQLAVRQATQAAQQQMQQNGLQQRGPAARAAIDAKPVQPASMQLVANANPVHQQVYGLADAGLSPVEIAQATSMPTGQVELILNLRKALGLAQGA